MPPHASESGRPEAAGRIPVGLGSAQAASTSLTNSTSNNNASLSKKLANNNARVASGTADSIMNSLILPPAAVKAAIAEQQQQQQEAGGEISLTSTGGDAPLLTTLSPASSSSVAPPCASSPPPSTTSPSPSLSPAPAFSVPSSAAATTTTPLPATKSEATTTTTAAASNTFTTTTTTTTMAATTKSATARLYRANPLETPVEVQAACDFIVSLLSNRFKDSVSKRFGTVLCKRLTERFDMHWHPRDPQQGSGYRCIMSSATKLDPVIKTTLREVLCESAHQSMTHQYDSSKGREQSREVLGGSAADLAAETKYLPGAGNFTMWIDPGEVSVRIGERGAATTVFNSPRIQMHGHQYAAAMHMPPPPPPQQQQYGSVPKDQFTQLIQQQHHFSGSSMRQRQPRPTSTAQKLNAGRSISPPPNLSPNARSFSPGGTSKGGSPKMSVYRVPQHAASRSGLRILTPGFRLPDQDHHERAIAVAN